MGTRMPSYLARMTFFSSTFLEPLASRTRSSLGRLKAMVWTPARASPAANSSSTTRIGDSEPRSRFLCSSGIGRLRSRKGSCALEDRQPLGVLGLGDADEGLEGRLVAEELVLVGLVGPDHDLDRRVEVHPRHVGLEVVVLEEGVGPQLEEALQAGVVGGRGGRPQLGGGHLQGRSRRPRCRAPTQPGRRRAGSRCGAS
jgi:hypothetical protein